MRSEVLSKGFATGGFWRKAVIRQNWRYRLFGIYGRGSVRQARVWSATTRPSTPVRGVRSPPSPPPISDSGKVLQKQAFLEPPENDGVAPRWSTVVVQIAIIETPVKGESSPIEPNPGGLSRHGCWFRDCGDRTGEETQAAYICSTETGDAVDDGVEDWLHVVRRARNGAQHFRDGRLLPDEFGHPIFRLRGGYFSVDTIIHAELVLGLDGEAA
jgi:hypothetical protein